MNETAELSNNNQSTETQCISTADMDRHNNDTKIIEFMQDLREAIQNGEFQRYEQQLEENSNKENNNLNESSEKPVSGQISNLINVNNLSNQTFNYIINWLKQQNKVSVLQYLNFIQLSLFNDRK